MSDRDTQKGKAAKGKAAGRLRITQRRSLIGHPRNQRDTVRSLGLRRIRDVVVQDDRPEIRGMINKVRHLVTVEEVTE